MRELAQCCRVGFERVRIGSMRSCGDPEVLHRGPYQTHAAELFRAGLQLTGEAPARTVEDSQSSWSE